MRPTDYRLAVTDAERHLAVADARMRRLIERHGPCGLVPEWKRSPYEALVRAIMYQQVHGKAAAAIHGRFLALAPDSSHPPPAAVLAFEDDVLRGVGLSRQKASYIRAIAEAAHAGIVPLRRGALSRASDEAIIERLTQVRGVGRWTVEMLLMFTLGRLDVLPVGDFGVRLGYQRITRRTAPVTPTEMAAAGERWRPYRSVAAWYLWRAADA
ncbi:MAG: DNA-3-methyladenine glycosylase 2 family protein [Burkholderiales bacterium]|nr:DNA-3-methyladenine glycosylase 2 family protein [Burkholderiales bacterium]